MKIKSIILSMVVASAVSIAGCNSDSDSTPISDANEVSLPSDVSFLDFPGDFKWGAATASYQVEGGRYDEYGNKLRSDTYWDMVNSFGTGVSADISIDQYHRYQDDVALMAQAGLKAYRFSLSIPRLFLTNNGFPVKGTWTQARSNSFQIKMNMVTIFLPNLTLLAWPITTT